MGEAENGESRHPETRFSTQDFSFNPFPSGCFREASELSLSDVILRITGRRRG